VTDRRYLSHYLKLYQQHLEKSQNGVSLFKEGLHFSFVEYGGGNITHWSFLDDSGSGIDVDRLCGKLFLITDKDVDSAKQQRHEKLKAKLNERYYCLECREIENLLTPNVVKQVVQQYEDGTAQFHDFSQADYKNESLGKYIEEKALRTAKKRKGSYQIESGTISDKVVFCRKAIDFIQKFDDLTPEAKVLTEKIYQFIKDKNQK